MRHEMPALGLAFFLPAAPDLPVRLISA